MIGEHERHFLRTHRLCVYGFPRGSQPPSLSPVYYVMDGDDLLISTTASREKAKAARKGLKVAVCVLGETPPFPYLTVYGSATVETEGVVDVMLRIGAAISGRPIDEASRPSVEQRATQEGRVIIRVKPERTFSTPPRSQARPASS
jgi:hypothetical protein